MSETRDVGCAKCGGTTVDRYCDKCKPIEIGNDGRCKCDCGTVCPLGRTGMSVQCSKKKLIEAGIEILLPEKQEVGANSHMHGGNHYRKVSGEQHWDRIVRLFPEHAHVYFIAAATKYLERYRDKNGVEDLRKSVHYIQKLIEVEEAKLLPRGPDGQPEYPNPYTEQPK